MLRSHYDSCYGCHNHVHACWFCVTQSLEVQISAKQVSDLLCCFDENTLVVGPVLEGHAFLPEGNPSTRDITIGDTSDNSSSCEKVTLRGRTCPWNTCAIWRLDKLGVVGFPLIGGR